MNINATPAPAQKKASLVNNAESKYASFAQRFIAGLIDGIILTVIGFVLGLAGGLMFGEGSKGMLNLIGTVIQAIYFVYFIGKTGQTPGKKAMKIKVVKIDTGTNPDYTGAFLREVVGKFISGVVFALGFLWVLWDEKKQGWHDKIAGTIVVRTDE